MERRDFFKMGGLGALAATGLLVPLTGRVNAKTASTLADRNFPPRYVNAFRRPPVLQPSNPDGPGSPLYVVTARQSTAQIVPGLSTPVYAYNGIFPGPTISVDQGVPVRLRVRNQLPATNPLTKASYATSTHLHGSASLPQFDGYADDLTKRFQAKTYEYPNFQDARTLWYHDHGVHHTAENVYGGLAAQYHLHDQNERDHLPQGEYDVPLTISDAMFAADGRLAFDDRTHSGLWGDVVLVNGTPWPVMEVKRRVYRFRILNASISRSYRLALSNGEAMTLVATDGGLIPETKPLSAFRHAPAERYEVLIDFRDNAPGTSVDLINLSNQNNIDYTHTGKVMRFKVIADDPDPSTDPLPATLPVSDRTRATMGLTPAVAKRIRPLRVHRSPNGTWMLNGRTWEDVRRSGWTEVFADPQAGDVEVWDIENRGGGWFHPVHIHLVDFVVLSRNGAPAFDWERGPKDVVYIGEEETVRVAMRFETGPGNVGGRYMLHCHNLPHEDHDMMWQFRVGNNADPATDPNDPIRIAPPEDEGPD